MASQLCLALATTTLLIILSFLITRHLRSTATEDNNVDLTNVKSISPAAVKLGSILVSALPDSVILPDNVAAFKQSNNSYWAQQECEAIPACVVRPSNSNQLSTAITVLKREYDEQRAKQPGGPAFETFFAVRSGGHSPVPGAASARGGVLIDLSLLRDVIASEDGSTVTIGAGAKWKEVYRTLEDKGLGVAGGRNLDVGVGGFTLGGGISFFSPRFGLTCSNVVSFEVVLASGSIVTASATSNADLWRALKGGSNNFAIVTSMTLPCFSLAKIWSGFIYLPHFQAAKILTAFHESVNGEHSSDRSLKYDSDAAGPILSFSWVAAIGIHVVAANLVYTKPLSDTKKWPAYWQRSGFASLWRFWSTCKNQTLSSATFELASLNPPGRRQIFACVTIKNHARTLTDAHAAYYDATASLKKANVKGLVWTLVLQPLLPDWARKGDGASVLGLQDSTVPLVIVSFTVNWDKSKDDDFVKEALRSTIARIEEAAELHGTGHPYRYLNYCGDWQKPFESYGQENLQFLKKVSRTYDPDGLFQKGCSGAFKLDMS